jgi:hypothetical protein
MVKPLTSLSGGSDGSSWWDSNKGSVYSAAPAAIGLAANLASIIKTPYFPKPALTSPIGLNTNYDISAGVSDVDNSVRGSFRTNKYNSSNSNATLARNQVAMDSGNAAKGRLYGEKANVETQLKNQNLMNIQQTTMANNQLINRNTEMNTQVKAGKYMDAAKAVNSAADKLNLGTQGEGDFNSLYDMTGSVSAMGLKKDKVAAMLANPKDYGITNPKRLKELQNYYNEQ